VFLEQIGFPVPAVPVLLGIGALAGEGRFSLPGILLIAVTASLFADAVWYEAGRRRGYGVLRVICRISLNAETCVDRTKDIFVRYGQGALVLAKFIPGLSTLAPPMAGMLRMKPLRFVLLDGAGALSWAAAYCLLGFVFGEELERIAALTSNLGSSFLVVVAFAVFLYLLWRWLQRQGIVGRLGMERISPVELAQRMQDGEKFSIVDLRHFSDLAVQGVKLPGALHIPPEDLDNRYREIPSDRDIVLYCT
jgi:membrane protein DedA with SNARE-associated domain